MAAKRKPFKRAGLHRLECPDCPCYGYFTVAMLETLGELPGCLARDCSGILEPTELELAFILRAGNAAAVAEFQAACQSIAHGQAAHGLKGRALEPVESVAAARVAAARRARARSNRLQALKPAAEPMPF